MSETKLEVKTVGHSEKFSLTSEIFAKLAKIMHFAKFAKNSLCLIAKSFDFFDIYFFKKNQIKIFNK